MLCIIGREEIAVSNPRKEAPENRDEKYPDEVYSSHHHSVEESREKYDDDDPSTIFRVPHTFEYFSSSECYFFQILEEFRLRMFLSLCESRCSEKWLIEHVPDFFGFTLDPCSI